MARGRSLVSILVVVVMGAAGDNEARVRGARALRRLAADEAQVRELLGSWPRRRGVPEPEERTDADLMYEAMLRWNGEPAGSAAVDRLIDSSKKEVGAIEEGDGGEGPQDVLEDPFADDPRSWCWFARRIATCSTSTSAARSGAIGPRPARRASSVTRAKPS